MFTFTKVLMRKPSPEMTQGISLEFKGVPNFEIALQQHHAYSNAILAAGAEPFVCPSDSRFPDGCFVEDTHLIVAEAIIRLNPGASSRSFEPDHLREYLPSDRPYLTLPSDFTIDGGDILQVDQKLFIGLSKRTRVEAAKMIRDYLGPWGYEVSFIGVPDGLHLKSGLTAVDAGTYVALDHWAGIPEIRALGNIISVPKDEYLAANILPINQCVIVPPGCPKTSRFIQSACKDKKLVVVDTSEFNKIDGALTRLSLRW